MSLCCQVHPIPSLGPQFLAHCSFSPCLLLHILSEGCGLESSVQGHPYHYDSPDDYFCLTHCVHIHNPVPRDYLGFLYDHCLIWSESGNHSLGSLVPQLCHSLHWFSGHCGPHPYLVLSLLIFALHLLGSYHELRMQYARGAV